MRRLRGLALGASALALGAQLFRPARTNAPRREEETLEAAVAVPPQVRAVLRRSCYDCHSQEVRWPWWSAVAPASWLIASDVRQARHAMDFSHWKVASEKERLDGICELATTGEMPPSRYTLVHRGTRLSPEEARLVCAWSSTGG